MFATQAFCTFEKENPKQNRYPKPPNQQTSTSPTKNRIHLDHNSARAKTPRPRALLPAIFSSKPPKTRPPSSPSSRARIEASEISAESAGAIWAIGRFGARRAEILANKSANKRTKNGKNNSTSTNHTTGSSTGRRERESPFRRRIARQHLDIRIPFWSGQGKGSRFSGPTSTTTTSSTTTTTSSTTTTTITTTTVSNTLVLLVLQLVLQSTAG